jgi:hypothetical protein
MTMENKRKNIREVMQTYRDFLGAENLDKKMFEKSGNKTIISGSCSNYF